MSQHQYEMAASIFGFVGASILSLDALFAVRHARSERGKRAIQEAVKKARGTYVDDADHTIASAYALQLLFARRSAISGRIGFGLMTLGFLLDLLAKW